MSGGRLVVLDRSGRPTKSFELPSGLATLGSGTHCDICFVSSTLVAPHHASVVVHANQTIIRNVGEGETLVNGLPVSVAALAHGDTVSVGGRELRWEYHRPPAGTQAQPAQPALYVRGRSRQGRAARRASGPAAHTPRDAGVQLALELKSRASAPGGSSKQVAIVQPQRRDTSERDDTNTSLPAISSRSNSQRARTSRNEQESFTQTSSYTSRRASTSRISLRSSPNLQNMTKATLWIESRKTPRKSTKISIQIPTPRRLATTKKSTPLRTAVLKNALTPNSSTALGRKSHSAQKTKVMKIEAPLKIDHTKQAALMLMTGHTPKSKIPVRKTGSVKPSPSYVVKKFSSVKNTPRSVNRERRAKKTGTPKTVNTGGTPKRPCSYTQGSVSRKSSKRSASKSITISDVTDLDGHRSMISESDIITRSTIMSPRRSQSLPSAKKSALKDPSVKKNTRKTESIKFDLSNLDGHAQDGPTVTDSTLERSYEEGSLPEEEMALRYDSDTTLTRSPSPRRPIHSRSSRIMEKTLGTSVINSSTLTRSSTSVPQSSRIRKSPRVSKILQIALENSEKNNLSASGTSRALSPRSPRDMETYSIVDLVSIDTNETRSPSIYGSADSSVIAFGTPAPTIRKTRSTINSALLGSSTPYTEKNTSTSTANEIISRRSKAIMTPEDAERPISVNSTRVSRTTRSRSRIDDATASLAFSVVDEQTEDPSPKSSKKSVQKTDRSVPTRSSIRRRATNVSVSNASSRSENDGEITPQNRYSPVEPTTPVLNIQNFLNSSQNSSTLRSKKEKTFLDHQRKTIDARVSRSETKTAQAAFKSKSLSVSGRKTFLRKNDKGVRSAETIITPKSIVKLVQEGVKNKHSSAKRPLSKRSIIDSLNESDIVKQLFNSPVKRKLSQSMTEFSRKRLFDDEDAIPAKRPTRNTIALTGRSPRDNVLVDRSENYTTEMFVSPLTSPDNSPNLDGVKRLFEKNTPENDLRDVRGVKALLRSPRLKRSVNNDLTDLTGVKTVFATSPRNRLSNVRGVKALFARLPENDLTRVSGVKTLFRSSRKTKPTKRYSPSVEGLKNLFNTRTPRNDLRNVSGVKRTMRITSPRNDLSDVRGVKALYARERTDRLSDLSGIEELFNESVLRVSNSERAFDELIGKPSIKATYSKSFTAKSPKKSIGSGRKYERVDELSDANRSRGKKRGHVQYSVEGANKTDNNESNKSITSQAHVVRQLQKLMTDTVQGSTPIRSSRVRSNGNKSVAKDQHSLPLKKRSLTKSFENRELELTHKRLPIKKRAVISSTPLKNNKFNWTAEVSALGRMSPIRAVNATPAAHTRTRQANKSPEVKPASGRRGARGIETDNPTSSRSDSTQRSAKRVRLSKAKALKDISRLKVTRARKNNQNLVSQVTNKSKGRPSLVITKKSPVLTPKPASGKKQISETIEKSKENLPNRIESKSTRARARLLEKAIEKPATPKVTRRQAARKAIDSPKQSSSKNMASPSKKSTRRQSRELKSNKETIAKVNKRSVVVTKSSSWLKPRATRSQKPEIDASDPKTTRKAVENVKDLIVEKPKTRGRTINMTEVQSEQKESKPRSTHNNVIENIDNTKRNTRSRKLQSVNTERSEPVTRARRAPPSDDTTVTGPKRKAVVKDNPVPSKVARTSENIDIKKNSRTRKSPQIAETKPQGAKWKRSTVKDTTVATNKRTRGNKKAENVSARENSKTVKNTVVKDMKEVLELKPARGRGRRAVTVVEEPSRESGRKRRVYADASPTKVPVKIAKKARTSTARAPVASPAAGDRARSTRSQPDPPTRVLRRRR